jgi:hypothetical protein
MTFGWILVLAGIAGWGGWIVYLCVTIDKERP